MSTFIKLLSNYCQFVSHEFASCHFGLAGGGLSGGTDEYQIEMRVPNHMVGLVIGKGGENIHRMQTQTGNQYHYRYGASTYILN